MEKLAEKLGVSNRAVSKWERGRALPDASIMLELCKILKITVNELLTGEVLNMDNYNKQLENNLIEMAKQKEKADKIMETLKEYCNCQIIGKVIDDEKITVKAFEGSELEY